MRWRRLLNRTVSSVCFHHNFHHKKNGASEERGVVLHSMNLDFLGIDCYILLLEAMTLQVKAFAVLLDVKFLVCKTETHAIVRIHTGSRHHRLERRCSVPGNAINGKRRCITGI